MNDTISVVIPIYNGEKTIEKCVKSVLASLYYNLEVILIDDGSSDKSGSICDMLKENDHRISVFHVKNGGVSKARNIGISVASGKFLAFVDCDDYVGNNYFSLLYDNIIQSQSDLAVCSIANIFGSIEKFVYASEGSVLLSDTSYDNRKKFLELNQKYLIYGPANKLYVTYLIKKNGVLFPEGMSYGEDLFFNVSYLTYCNLISFSKEPIYFYDRGNMSSLSQKYREDLFETGLSINLKIKDLFERLNYWQDDEKKFVYRRIFDDAFNAIFSLWDKQCRLAFAEKVKRINSILNNTEVCNSYNMTNIDDYPKLYRFLMKNKEGMIISVLLELREIIQSKV